MRFRGLMVVVALSAVLGGCGKKQETATEEVEEKVVSVRIAQVAKRRFEDRINVQGTLAAKNYANVAARVDGNLVDIPVDKGDAVVAGKTKLFETDKDNRERAVETARQNVAVLRQNHKVALANVRRVEVELKKAALDKERYVRLHNSGNATDNEVELYTTQFEQATVSLEYAKASADAVAEQVRAAEIALKTAEKDLADCTIYAPISGVVSNRMKEPGEQGSKGGVVLRIEDLESIEAVAHIPAQYYSMVETGKTKVRVSVSGHDLGEFAVTYRSPIIDVKLRTFEVKAQMRGDAAGGLVPGAMADITMLLVSREGLAVPTHSILHRRKGAMVYLPKDGKAVPCLVKCGLENDGMTEIEGDDIAEGTEVIAEGQYMLSDNDAVKVQE
ncbi:MAG: efflux RND transporter periplasmic adaptor subunit [Victivallales bacterium]|nr:efflux RND transporter periplasmic adaptor subunit [Victivallales bacterium]